MKPNAHPSRRAVLRIVVGAIMATPLLAAVVRYLQPPAQAQRRTVRLMRSELLGTAVHTASVMGVAVALRRRGDGSIVAFDLACTHAGCPVTPVANGFHCACHGGRFDAEGAPAGGPVRRPLRTIAAYDEDGMVVVRMETSAS